MTPLTPMLGRLTIIGNIRPYPHPVGLAGVHVLHRVRQPRWYISERFLFLFLFKKKKKHLSNAEETLVWWTPQSSASVLYPVTDVQLVREAWGLKGHSSLWQRPIGRQVFPLEPWWDVPRRGRDLCGTNNSFNFQSTYYSEMQKARLPRRSVSYTSV